jgi:hypothetical protein
MICKKMAIYRLGSTGAEVGNIQTALQQDGLYDGDIDGIFGDETDAAVRAFQEQNGLDVDGVVGPITLAQLFPAPTSPPTDPTSPSIGDQPLEYRCMALTGAFETGKPFPGCFSGLAGSFDGMGISFGALQWNLGQKTLQPMLSEMASSHPDVWSTVFGSNADVLSGIIAESLADQIAWARSIQSSGFVVAEPWNSQFVALGQTPEYQAIEIDRAANIFANAQSLCTTYELNTGRGVSLMYDIVTQDGSISASTKEKIFDDYANLASDLSPDDLQVARMKIIAQRRASAANSASYQDVLSRKMTIAEGQGTVHGATYDLSDYGLTLDPLTGA